MPRRFGVTKVGVNDGRKLRKVVGIEYHADPYGSDGRYWEKLSCGHLGKPVGADGRASQRWCSECKWDAEAI